MVGSVKFSATESGSEYLNIRILYYIWKEINLKKKHILRRVCYYFLYI